MENVIHGASIGAGEDEPVLVARVQTRPPHAAVASADGEAEDDQSDNEPPEEEVELFKELWLSLQEREQRLELRLMELDSLREQEAAIRELESRASAAAVEARLLERKVASLQEENETLRAQASELDAARTELGRAREKLRALGARVEGEREEARREAAALREMVTELEKKGEERERALAEEAAAMRKANVGLVEENRDLALRLQDAEQAASSVNLVIEEEDMAEEANELRKTNERLTRQIEQLHGDHCKHVEELVYLKWVNACLRHELRGNDDQHPSSGQQDHAGAGVPSSAVELSKSMSYRSSEKAKELMLRYGNLGLEGFDPALFSPLNESLYGDGHDQDHAVAVAASAPEKRAGHGKLKFLRNIKKLLASGSRKGHGHGHEHKGKKKAPAAHDEHFEKAIRWLSSHDALGAGDSSCESTPLSSCQRTPLSSVTTVDSHAARERGGGRETAAEPAAASRLPEEEEEEEAKLARSKSDAGASYGREATRYHALRPEHPADVGPHHALHAPEKPRRYSEELRSS